MYRHYVSGLIIILLLGFLAMPGRGDSFITREMRKEDSRLEKKVTLFHAEIYLAELLEELTGKTGVSLSIGERNALSGVPLLVYVEETPLADVLNALWSQMGYLKALWSWERTGETSPYSYRFVPSLAAKRLSAMMKDEVFSTFEKQVKRLIDAARMTPEERKNLQGDNLTPDYVLNDDRCREGIKILADNLTPSMQQSVIRGKKEITVPIDQLSEAGKKYVQRELDLYNDREAKPNWYVFQQCAWIRSSPLS